MHTLNLRSFLWFTTGVALTITTIAVFTTLRASAAVTPGESTFVPITPCRLFDTRAGSDNVGTRDRPIGQEPFKAQVTGTNGGCTIPTDATAISMNVTIVNPTAGSFLQAYPADIDRPEQGSNLNFVAGQAPVPNKVDVKLGAAGAIKVFNNTGTVDALADVVGYYKSSTIADLEARLVAAENTLTARAPLIQQNALDVNSLLTDTNVIPSGTTVTGFASYDNAADDAGAFDSFVVELPGRAPAPLTSAMVNFEADFSAVTIDDDATCTGNFRVPTAPSGKVCLYWSQYSSVDNVQGRNVPIAEFADRYFSVRLRMTAVSTAPGLSISWAYTAP